jgi:hypothetical protein
MARPDHKALPVGTLVHVEFDGMVYDEGEHPMFPASPNHFAVSDGQVIHHIHRVSDSVTVAPKPRPDLVLNQVWRSEPGQDARSYVVYEEVDYAFGPERFYLCGPRNATGGCTYSGEDFFASFPDAFLLLEADGGLAS